MSALLTVRDLAARWQVKERAVYDLVESRDEAHPLPVRRVGRRLRFAVEDIEAWERGQR